MTCTLKSRYLEITVAEFFAGTPFQVVDGSEITPGLCIVRACKYPAILYLHEHAVQNFRKCINGGQSVGWILNLPVDSIVSIDKNNAMP